MSATCSGRGAGTPEANTASGGCGGRPAGCRWASLAAITLPDSLSSR